MSLGSHGGGPRPHNFNVPLMNINDGNLTFVGTKQRIRGFMSGSPQSNHLAFQSTVPASNSTLYIVPTAVSGGAASWNAANSADIDNTSYGQFGCDATSAFVNSQINGTGTQLPIAFRINNVEFARIDTAGNLCVNTVVVNAQLNVVNSGAGAAGYFQSTGSTDTLFIKDTGANGANFRLTGNGGTTPSKYIRAAAGHLDIVNDAYSIVIVSIDDVGSVVTTGNITSAGTIFAGLSGTNGYAAVVPGSASNTGYLAWFAANGNRQGYIGFSTTTGAGDGGTIPVVCGTLAVAGSLTTTGNVTVSGAATVAGFIVANDIGGTIGGQMELRNIAVGATNIHKYMRVNQTGGLEWINSAYTNVVMALLDTGGLQLAPISGVGLTINGVAGQACATWTAAAGNVVFRINTADGHNAVDVAGPAATQINMIGMAQSGQSSWVIYQPASQNDFHIFGNGADRAIFGSNGSFQANGSVIPNVVASTAWGLDLTQGTVVTIANNGTFDFATGSGFHMFYDDSGGGAAYAFSVFGQTVVTNFSGTLFSNTLGTSGKMNFGYNGSTAYRLENKTGGSKNIYATCIRARAAN